MPLDINLLTIRTKLSAEKSGDGKEKAESVKSLKTQMVKERAHLIQDLMPMMRENLCDRLNR